MSQKNESAQAAVAEKRADAPIEEAQVLVDTKATNTITSAPHAVKVDTTLKPKVEKALKKEAPNGRASQIKAVKAEVEAAAEAVANDKTVGDIDVFIAGKVNGEWHHERVSVTPQKSVANK